MKLLIIVDFQKDYVDGTLGIPKAKELEDKIYNIIPEYDNYIFLMDTHDKQYLDTFEGKMLPTPHCIKDSIGYQIYGKVNEYKKTALAVINHNTFPSLELAEFLKDHSEFDEVDLCGLYSHMQVLSNAIMVKSVLKNSLISVLKNYSASFDSSLEAKAYNILNGLHIEISNKL